MPSVGRVYPSLADCAPPPPSSRRACQPFLKGRPPHNMLFPVNPPKSGAPHSSAFAPPGQTASSPHPRSAPCPIGARQRRPTRAVPARHPSSTSAASARPALPSTPTSPPPNQPQAAGPCSWACRRLHPLPPHQKRKEAPMPPARGAWARRLRANGAGCRHCRPLAAGPPMRSFCIFFRRTLTFCLHALIIIQNTSMLCG